MNRNILFTAILSLFTTIASAQMRINLGADAPLRKLQIAEMAINNLYVDSVDEQTGSGTRTVNGFKVFKENLELYTGVKGQGLAIWVPSDVKKQVELLCAKAKTNIPIRSMAAAMIMAFIEEHRRELNNL